ncbi:MAG: hypothetical protein QMC83_07590 [Thermodesulfovibrionales bacterium]|nr:hypothetical protein [Thermodesulfovibrionales bacterium]
MKNAILLALALLLLLGVGCTKSIRYSEEEIKGFPPNIQEHIKKGEVTPGMTQSQVRYSWDAPNSVRTLAPSEDGKSREEWVYERFKVFKTRLIFTDGKITEIISNDPGIRK